MKNIVTILCSILLMSSCNLSKKEAIKVNKSSIKQEIKTLLNDWHLAATEANYNNYFSKMDSISVFIGTDATEKWNKQQFEALSKPYFVNGKAWDFKTLERNIYINQSGDFVWFDELLNTWMGTCRGSGVL